jgi:hypothetical protein
MGGYVGNAPAYYGSSLGSNADISQKYTMGDISKGVANTLAHQKQYKKQNFLHRIDVAHRGELVDTFLAPLNLVLWPK